MNPSESPSLSGSGVSKGWAGPLLILVAGLALTALMVSSLRRADRDLEGVLFRQDYERCGERMEARFEALAARLQQAREMIQRQPPLTPGEWDGWFDGAVRARFPEVQQLDYGVRADPDAETPGSNGIVKESDRSAHLVLRTLAVRDDSSAVGTDPLMSEGKTQRVPSVHEPDSGNARATFLRSLQSGKVLLSGLIPSPALPSTPGSGRLLRLYLPVYPLAFGKKSLSHATGALSLTLDLDVMVRLQAGPQGRELIGSCRVKNDDSGWTALDAGGLSQAVAATIATTNSCVFFGRTIECTFRSRPDPVLSGSRGRIWVVGGLGTLFSGLLAGMVWTEGKARRNESRFANELRETNGRLAEVTRERERLTRDLHDGTIQSIYAVGFDLQRVRNLVDRNPGEARAELTRTMATLNQVVMELREFIVHAEPGSPSVQNVDTVLQALVERARQNTQAEISLELAPDAAQLVPSQQAVEVLQIVREALTNSLRHAYPRQIGIALTRDGRDWRLTIADDGAGFDPQQVAGRTGHGLRNLQDRAAELGGEGVVVSAPGTGTAVRVVFPVLSRNMPSSPTGGAV